MAQLTGDAWQLSPSVFSRNLAIGTIETTQPGSFFKCPVCDSALDDTPPLLTCQKCGQEYPVENGIYDFRLEALK